MAGKRGGRSGDDGRTQCVLGTYAARTQDGVSRRDTHTRLVFPFNSGCLVDFLEYLAGLAVFSVSPDSRIVESRRQSQSTLRNGSLRRSESHRQSQSTLRSTTTSYSSSGTGWFRRPVWASLLPEVPGLRFVLLYLSGGPGATALGHTGSVPDSPSKVFSFQKEARSWSRWS